MIRGLSTSNGGLRRPRPRPLRTRLNAVRKGKEKNVVCTKTVVAKVEHVEKVRMLCKEYQERMKGNSSETHQGVVTFECTEDTFEENAFHFWERYKDANSFNQNMTSEDTSYFLEKLSEYVEKPVGIALFEYMNGEIGNCCVEIGPKGEGGLDDATGANKYGGGARYEQTSNAVQFGNEYQ